MKKHSLNILPEASPEDFALIRDDIKENGFNPAFPVVLYEGAILDGWNRYRACKELGIEPPTTTFHGAPLEAFKLVCSTNKRRNLTKSQWAAFAVDSGPILKAIREEAERKMKAGKADPRQIIAEGSKDENRTSARVAEMFNTNRTYVAKAEKLKEESPELFEKVKAGLVTITEATKPKPEPQQEPKLAKIKVQINEGWGLWLIAKARLDQIAETDQSFEKAFQAALSYVQQRIKNRP